MCPHTRLSCRGHPRRATPRPQEGRGGAEAAGPAAPWAAECVRVEPRTQMCTFHEKPPRPLWNPGGHGRNSRQVTSPAEPCESVTFPEARPWPPSPGLSDGRTRCHSAPGSSGPAPRAPRPASSPASPRTGLRPRPSCPGPHAAPAPARPPAGPPRCPPPPRPFARHRLKTNIQQQNRRENAVLARGTNRSGGSWSSGQISRSGCDPDLKVRV